jgi:transcription antitermination factor NusG
MSIGHLHSFNGEWFAVQVWSGREHLTSQQLSRRGYEIFLPCTRERRRWSDRVKVIERALFAGYLFCRIDLRVTSSIVATPGVIRIVGHGEHPLPVPADEIDAIRRVVEANHEAEACVMPRVGERVSIEQGPLSGLEGVVMFEKSRTLLVVGVTLLQRAVALEIQADWLAPAPLGEWCDTGAAAVQARCAIGRA